MSQKIAAYDAHGNIIAYYDDIDSPVPAGVTRTVTISYEEWQKCISTSGYRVANGVLVPPPAPTAAQLVAEAQATQIARVTSACAAKIVAGFQSSALGVPCAYPSTLIDQQNLAASVLDSLLPGLPADWATPFWCADSVGVWSYASHTAAQIQQVGRDGKAAIVAAIQRKAGLVAQIEAASTVEEVRSIAWNTP